MMLLGFQEDHGWCVSAQAAGDPHIVTLDGLNYTFNGEGDFVLLQDTNGTVKVHVHASRAVDIDG